jgi:hypothetical protein
MCNAEHIRKPTVDNILQNKIEGERIKILMENWPICTISLSVFHVMLVPKNNFSTVYSIVSRTNTFFEGLQTLYDGMKRICFSFFHKNLVYRHDFTYSACSTNYFSNPFQRPKCSYYNMKTLTE